jgi:hypothetical protein
MIIYREEECDTVNAGRECNHGFRYDKCTILSDATAFQEAYPTPPTEPTLSADPTPPTEPIPPADPTPPTEPNPPTRSNPPAHPNNVGRGHGRGRGRGKGIAPATALEEANLLYQLSLLH